MRTSKGDIESEPIEKLGSLLGNPMMPIRDVAMVTGIGRTRVVQIEQKALKKLRQAFASLNVTTQSGFENLSDERIDHLVSRNGPSPDISRDLYPPESGWLAVTKIRSINGGCEEMREVVRAYQLLKRANEDIFRPPVLISTGQGIVSKFRMEAAAEYRGVAYIRWWPTRGRSASAARQVGYPVTLIVESEFGRDHAGDFDIPVVVCVVISARPHAVRLGGR